MKPFSLLILTFALTHGLFSQTTVVNDDFDTDIGTFTIENQKEFTTSVKNGYYNITVKPKKAYWFTHYFDVTTVDENFIVETTMEQKKGSKNTYYGLVIGLYGDKSDYMNFYINNKGYFFITHYYSGTFHNNVDKTFSKAIHSSGPQVLKVVREFNVCKYYVNDVLVYQNAARSYYGNGFGVEVLDKGEFLVDNFNLTTSTKVYNLVENPIIGRKMENLGRNINTQHTEIAPIVSPDGNTLYFVREGSPFNIGSEKQDVWYSMKDKNGNWGPAFNMGFPINNAGSNFVECITPDNNKVYVGNTYTLFGESDGSGLSVGTKVGDRWTVPRTLYIQNLKNYDQYVDYYPDLSNNFILMAIDNGATYGKKDIFISWKQGDGSYGTPKNLGTDINTCGDEFGIVLAADGRTLYFNSFGHTSYGSADVFVSKRLDDTWTHWSTPLNLGPEVNSDNWEGQISIDASGEYGYISTSNNVSDGSEDIFRFKMGSAKPEPVVMIYGRVLNSKTKDPLGATIDYNNLSDNKNMGTAMSDENFGTYKIVLPVGKAYSFNAEKNGFYPISENMDLTSITEYTEIERNLYLSPVEVGDVIRLNNIFFDTDKSDLKPESEAELNRLLDFLNANPTTEIQISGHTDNKGSDTHNQVLSQDRVNSVIKFLVSKGIKESRLVGIGYGESKPISTNETEEGRAQNRRVEFTILKK